MEGSYRHHVGQAILLQLDNALQHKEEVLLLQEGQLSWSKQGEEDNQWKSDKLLVRFLRDIRRHLSCFCDLASKKLLNISVDGFVDNYDGAVLCFLLNTFIVDLQVKRD